MTETDYFNHLRRELRGSLVSIEISDERGDPLRLVQEAAKIRDRAAAQARRLRDDNLRFDSVWCACDVDEHQRLPDAIRLARSAGINMAVSNPCFELWPLLHFEDQTAHVHGRQLRDSLRRHLPGYEKKLSCERLNEGRQEACRRAEALDQMHARFEREPGSNPSTGVWRLVKLLEESAGPPATGRASHRERRII